MAESPTKAAMNKVISGRVSKPARSNRTKVSYVESGDENDENDSDPVIKSAPGSFAVQSGNTSFAARISETYGNSFDNHYGFNGHDEEKETYYGAVEELEEFEDI
jgi:hypothetical protein